MLKILLAVCLVIVGCTAAQSYGKKEIYDQVIVTQSMVSASYELDLEILNLLLQWNATRAGGVTNLTCYCVARPALATTGRCLLRTTNGLADGGAWSVYDRIIYAGSNPIVNGSQPLYNFPGLGFLPEQYRYSGVGEIQNVFPGLRFVGGVGECVMQTTDTYTANRVLVGTSTAGSLTTTIPANKMIGFLR